MNFFDYFGSIVSYMVVSIPLFTGEFDDLMPGELAAVISKVYAEYSTLLTTPTCYLKLSQTSHAIYNIDILYVFDGRKSEDFWKGEYR